jgi:Kelch motif.
VGVGGFEAPHGDIKPGECPMSRRSLVATSVLLLTLTLPGCRDDSSPLTDPAGSTSIPGADPALVSNGWSSRANMPSDRWYVATATFPDRIGGASLYAIGGSNGNTPYDAPLGKVQVYNPATNTWTTKASLPHVVAGFGSNGAQVIDSLIYVPGGQHNVPASRSCRSTIRRRTRGWTRLRCRQFRHTVSLAWATV